MLHCGSQAEIVRCNITVLAITTGPEIAGCDRFAAGLFTRTQHELSHANPSPSESFPQRSRSVFSDVRRSPPMNEPARRVSYALAAMASSICVAATPTIAQD